MGKSEYCEISRLRCLNIAKYYIRKVLKILDIACLFFSAQNINVNKLFRYIPTIR